MSEYIKSRIIQWISFLFSLFISFQKTDPLGPARHRMWNSSLSNGGCHQWRLNCVSVHVRPKRISFCQQLSCVDCRIDCVQNVQWIRCFVAVIVTITIINRQKTHSTITVASSQLHRHPSRHPTLNRKTWIKTKQNDDSLLSPAQCCYARESNWKSRKIKITATKWQPSTAPSPAANAFTMNSPPIRIDASLLLLLKLL